jgi:MerR family transcriptional regulator, light-induced transcriptional regulator
MNLGRFEQVLDNYIGARGVEKTIHQLIFPFLEKVGVLWLTNHINPAQEHLVTNIIRQKIIVGIATTISAYRQNKKVLLFLPEGEYHELGLLFMHFILKGKGVNVIYVGANVPLKDLVYIVNTQNPEIIYTHLTSVAKNFQFDKFLTAVSAQIPKTPLVISGTIASTWQKKIPANVIFKKSLSEVMQFVNTL